MSRSLLTVKAWNLYGNVALGASALALGLAWVLDASGFFVFAAACSVVVIGCFSLVVCLSKRREPFDEMAVVHDGFASSAALMTVLIAIGVFCIWRMLCNPGVETGFFCCAFIGFGLLVRGIVFAWLERGCGVDHQDA